ncbi:MAG: hypothetical protein AAF219_01435 [Myxococcota bacterium]
MIDSIDHFLCRLALCIDRELAPCWKDIEVQLFVYPEVPAVWRFAAMLGSTKTGCVEPPASEGRPLRERRS